MKGLPCWFPYCIKKTVILKKAYLTPQPQNKPKTLKQGKLI